MGLYSENHDEDLEGLDMNAIIESFLIDDLMHNYSEETVREFCAPGGVADALLEARLFQNKTTIHRLNKKDDLTRRQVVVAIQMANEKKDPLYAKLVKYSALRKQTRAKIVDKYGSKAAKIAVKGQKEYIKTMKNVNLPNIPQASWAGAEDR